VTFGRLWKADLNRNDTVFREIMTVAIGEMVLENMLAKVKEVWLPK
jgi:dynein heavy chain 1